MFIQVEPVRASVLDVLVCCVDMVLNTEWVQIEAIDLTSDGSAWGFGITGGRSTGVVVKTIVPGSVTDKDGRLQIGDHIIQIGDINLRGMGSEQVAMVLRQCGSQVHLIVARPIEPTPEDNLLQSASAIVPTRVLNEPEELEQTLNIYQPGPNGFSDPMMQDMYALEPNTLIQKEPTVYKGRNEKMDMECFEVNLIKDHQGLGIIVAGYVCEREDISGIFVKSIAKGSVADLCGQIRVHDQVVEVDGHPLKGYSNCEAVEILRNTGKYVKLQLARYNHGSKFDHLQEAMGSDKVHSSYDYTSASRKSFSNPPITDNCFSLSSINTEEIKTTWEKVLGPRSEVIIAPLQKNDNEVGFGFNVETRRDDKSVLHHFISDICKGYSVDRSEMLYIGDELLEVNGKQLRDTKYSEILTIFKSLPSNIVLVCGRSHHWTSNLSLIPWSERLIKAKSDSYLALRRCHRSEYHNLNRRSLEILSSLATWSSEPHFIDLVKGEEGLGFSIVEYKDNIVPNIQDENVIIVWSLVPGAAAQKDGRLLPGDRLLSVNNINFRHTNFEMATQVLKHVPKGVVRLGIAKPTTLSKSVPAKISFKEPLETQQEIIPNGSTLKVFEYNGICHTYEEPLNLYGTRSQTPSSLFSFGNDSRCSTPFSSPGLSSSGKLWGFEIPLLPSALERIVKIKKGNNKLGLILDMVDRGQNGMVVKSIRPASAVEKDGTVQIGDYILGVNSENMRNITRSQARAIIRRAELTSSDIVIKYIPAGDAAVHQQSAVLAKIHEGNVSPTPSIISRQPSPRVFPAYYRSPYFSHKSTKSTPDRDDADGQISPFSFLSEDDVLATPSSLYTDNFDSSSDDLLLDQSSDGGMKEGGEQSEAFPSVEDRILLFQGTKHQVPSKFSRMSTSPTVSPVQDESPQQQKSPELPETPNSIPEASLPGSDVSSPVVTTLGCQWGVNRTVELWREPGQEIGIGVVMGCIDVQEEEPSAPLSGIFIKHIVPDSPAGKDGTINRGDRIVAVNDADLQNASYKEAIEIIQNSDNPIKLTVQSLVPWFPTANDSATQSPSSKEPSTPLRSPQASFHAEKLKQRSMSEDEDFALDTDFQGKVYTSKGVEIDRNSAGFLKIPDDSEDEDDFGYTNKKVQKKYGDLKGTVLLIEVEKGANGLGISLAGNKNRSKMSSFVCGLHPNGKAAKLNVFQVGDELLEVNGMVLFNRCHLNVSAVIRGIMTPTCKFVVVRRENSIEDMAVKPITHFPVDLENEKIEDLISSHPGVRTITTKKGDHGLGIMILEGKHIELGRGIFISDIQKDSPAEKAGLGVGDMILAVNKTKLIGADYDLAASVLKNEDGPMTFLVVNSQKPASSPVHNDISHDKKPRNSLGLLPENDTRRKSSTPSSLCPTPSPNSSSPSPNLPACPIPPPVEFSDPCVTLDPVGKEIVVDIHREKNGLGLGIVGGSDTPIGCIVIHEIYANGAIAQDGRLKPGDQILEVNNHDLRHATHQEAINFLRHSVPTVQIRVYRHKETTETLSIAEFTVELYKKPGRGLGLTIVGKSNAPGVYISEVIKGGVADTDGSLMEGDQILEVNGQNLRESDQEAAAALLKTAVGKITMKIGRLKCEINLPPRRSMH